MFRIMSRRVSPLLHHASLKPKYGWHYLPAHATFVFKMRKDGDPYIERMSQKRKDKIGSMNTLDKQWAEKPMQVIKSPHKLTEVELYQTLQKIVEMPEKRLKTMVL